MDPLTAAIGRIAMTVDEAWGFFGLEPGASPDEIKKRYRDLAMLLHPDRNPTLGQRWFQHLTEAHEVVQSGRESGRGRRRPAWEDFWDEDLDRREREHDERRRREQEESERRRREEQERLKREQENLRQRREQEQNPSVLEDLVASGVLTKTPGPRGTTHYILRLADDVYLGLYQFDVEEMQFQFGYDPEVVWAGHLYATDVPDGREIQRLTSPGLLYAESGDEGANAALQTFAEWQSKYESGEWDGPVPDEEEGSGSPGQGESDTDEVSLQQVAELLEQAGIEASVDGLGGGTQGVIVNFPGTGEKYGLAEGDGYVLVTDHDGPWVTGLYLHDTDEGDEYFIAEGAEAEAMGGAKEVVHRVVEWYLEHVGASSLLPREGLRVRFRKDWEIYPHALIEAGEAGTVTGADAEEILIRMDTHYDGLDEWDNVVVFSSHDLDWLEEYKTLAELFWAQVEVRGGAAPKEEPVEYDEDEAAAEAEIPAAGMRVDQTGEVGYDEDRVADLRYPPDPAYLEGGDQPYGTLEIIQVDRGSSEGGDWNYRAHLWETSEEIGEEDRGFYMVLFDEPGEFWIRFSPAAAAGGNLGSGPAKWEEEFGSSYAVPQEILDLVSSGEAADLSWHNNQAPTFGQVTEGEGWQAKLEIWSDHPDQKWREDGGPRFGVFLSFDASPEWEGWAKIDNDWFQLYEGDDVGKAIVAYRQGQKQVQDMTAGFEEARDQ